MDSLTLPDLRGLVIEKPRDQLVSSAWLATAWPSRPMPLFRAFFRLVADQGEVYGGALHVRPPLDGKSERNLMFCVFLERHFQSLKPLGTGEGIWTMSRADYALMRLTFGNHKESG